MNPYRLNIVATRLSAGKKTQSPLKTKRKQMQKKNGQFVHIGFLKGLAILKAMQVIKY